MKFDPAYVSWTIDVPDSETLIVDFPYPRESRAAEVHLVDWSGGDYHTDMPLCGIVPNRMQAVRVGELSAEVDLCSSCAVIHHREAIRE